jgi:hypothetical protein
LIPYDWLPQQTRLKFNNLIGIYSKYDFKIKNVHIYDQFYEHARHFLTINRNRPNAFENRNGETANRNGETARHIRNGETETFKPNTKIDQKQAHRETLRSTNIIVEQTQVHRDKPRSIVEL